VAEQASPSIRTALTAPVLVGALGYFVDIFDLLIFPVTSVPSLTELGVPPEARRLVVERILNWQMIGMLIGGVFWGVLGDKIGRRSVLFGSITLYSLANLANGFIDDVETYRYVRLLAGFGLAGELGAAITLVSETLPKEARGYGTAIVASVGVSGAVFAGIIGNSVHWRTAYFIGGGLGLALLLLRVGFGESTMFTHTKSEGVERGNFFALFWPLDRLARYLCCILIGVPLWFGVGILITQSVHLAADLGIVGAVTPATAVAICYGGLTLGDFASGGLSQVLKSRKKAVGVFLAMTAGSIILYCTLRGISATGFYVICGLLGVSLGYWAVFVTIASEQFGTNIRATATTTVPNWVRASLVPITIAFEALHQSGLSLVHSALVLGLSLVVMAGTALYFLPETHGRDLDFVE
jgi:MFS transporter, putative metabolite:H+ symporter